MSYSNKKVIVSVIYCSTSQNNNKFDRFLSYFQKFLNDISNSKPSLPVVTGDINSRCSSWWSNDINITEGLNLFSLTSSNGFSQLIHEPTHIQANSFSCTDLVFIDQRNLSMHLFTQTAITKLYTPSLTSIFTTLTIPTISMRL